MKLPTLQTIKKAPLRWHWLAYGCIGILAVFLFVHPDIVETANHSYVLLESIFSGRFMHFYGDVIARGSGLYYINNAHYNIVIYLLFAIAELPVFIVCKLFSVTVSEALLYFIGKLVSAGFFVGCLVVIRRVAKELGLSESDSRISSLFMALWPPAFMSVLIMGQYDSLCLFFTLLGFLLWLRGNHTRSALWFGLGAACKFFPLLLFIPLLLLTEKRILHILKYGVLSLWLVLPTTLLFWGRTGDMGAFNGAMVGRLFSAKLPAALDMPLFPVLFLLLCFVAYLWCPQKEEYKRIGLWLCLAVFGVFFLLVSWHPQWVILLAPFVILTTLLEKQRTPWFWLDMALGGGFLLYCFVLYPRQLEANLLDFGLIGVISGKVTTQVPEALSVLHIIERLPVVGALPMVLFGGALLAQIILKTPGKQGTPATLLAKSTSGPAAKWLPLWAWAIWGVCFAVWLAPTLLTWVLHF